jgi:zinc protease
MHEIEELNRTHALDYYKRFYSPDNAILVVAGDVDADEVRALAERTYGRNAPHTLGRPVRSRPREPEPRASRSLCVADPKVEQPTLQRLYLVPSSRTAEGRDAHALEVLAEAIGGGPTSLLYRKLVLETGRAVNAGAWYMGSAIDATRLAVYAVPSAGLSPAALEDDLDQAIATLPDTLDEQAIERAKTRLIAEPSIRPTAKVRWHASMVRLSPSAKRLKTYIVGRTTFERSRVTISSRSQSAS